MIRETTALVLLYRACKDALIAIETRTTSMSTEYNLLQAINRAENLLPDLKEHANVVVPFSDRLRKSEQ